MGRPKAEDPSVQISVRIPSENVERISKLAKRITRKHFPATKASVLRAAIQKGIEHLEALHRGK